MNKKIDEYNNTPKNDDFRRKWELLKAEIKAYTIQYSTDKNMKRKNKGNAIKTNWKGYPH